MSVLHPARQISHVVFITDIEMPVSSAAAVSGKSICKRLSLIVFYIGYDNVCALFGEKFTGGFPYTQCSSCYDCYFVCYSIHGHSLLSVLLSVIFLFFVHVFPEEYLQATHYRRHTTQDTQSQTDDAG